MFPNKIACCFYEAEFTRPMLEMIPHPWNSHVNFNLECKMYNYINFIFTVRGL